MLELDGTDLQMPASPPYNLKPKPWFSPLNEGLIERVLKLTHGVDEGMDMGFHLCYVDAGHKHFIEPKDTSLLVEVANLISAGVKRDVSWVHMPVPKDRVDEEYYAPLKELKLRKETELSWAWCMEAIWRGRGRGSRWRKRWWGVLALRQGVGWGGAEG